MGDICPLCNTPDDSEKIFDLYIKRDTNLFLALYCYMS